MCEKTAKKWQTPESRAKKVPLMYGYQTSLLPVALADSIPIPKSSLNYQSMGNSRWRDRESTTELHQYQQ